MGERLKDIRETTSDAVSIIRELGAPGVQESLGKILETTKAAKDIVDALKAISCSVLYNCEGIFGAGHPQIFKANSLQSRSVNHGTVCPEEKPPETTPKAVLIFGLPRCVFSPICLRSWRPRHAKRQPRRARGYRSKLHAPSTMAAFPC